MLSRNTILNLAIHLIILFFLAQCSNTTQPSIACFQDGETEYLLTNGTSVVTTGFSRLSLIDSKTSSAVSFSIASESEETIVLGNTNLELQKEVVFVSGGAVSIIISTQNGDFPITFDVQNYPFRNVMTYSKEDQKDLALIIQEPRYPAYGIFPISFLVAEESENNWEVSDDWKVSFVPWMNMGQKGHGSQFNIQPTKLDSISLPWQKGKVSFSMPGEWDLRLSLTNLTSKEIIKDTLIVDVLDEEELEAILHIIPLMGR